MWTPMMLYFWNVTRYNEKQIRQNNGWNKNSFIQISIFMLLPPSTNVLWIMHKINSILNRLNFLKCVTIKVVKMLFWDWSIINSEELLYFILLHRYTSTLELGFIKFKKNELIFLNCSYILIISVSVEQHWFNLPRKEEEHQESLIMCI